MACAVRSVGWQMAAEAGSSRIKRAASTPALSKASNRLSPKGTASMCSVTLGPTGAANRAAPALRHSLRDAFMAARRCLANSASAAAACAAPTPPAAAAAASSAGSLPDRCPNESLLPRALPVPAFASPQAAPERDV